MFYRPIPLDKLPESERPKAAHLPILFMNLFRFVGTFSDALSLFDFVLPICEGAQKRSNDAAASGGFPSENDLRLIVRGDGWKMVIARDAAISIFNFSETLNAISDILTECPGVKSFVDEDTWDSATTEFDKFFPHARRMRNAVSHAAEEIERPSKYRNNNIKPGKEPSGITVEAEGALFVGTHINGREIKMPNKGVMVSVIVSDESLSALMAVELLARKAFGMGSRPFQLG